jgi:hypothetical protein
MVPIVIHSESAICRAGLARIPEFWWKPSIAAVAGGLGDLQAKY